MASSSSCGYDVFLSFRGEDTRGNFLSHLYSTLCRKKIHTFIDYELKRGDKISLALFHAIECSKISVIIFSKDYASSTWCLNELVHILQCHQMNDQMVLPVFYRIDPSDVRKQKGSFKDAFVQHKEHFKPKKIQEWKDVLKQASNLSGWASKDVRSDAELVDLIVSDILKKLENLTIYVYPDGFVGLNSQIKEIRSLLCLRSPDSRIVGIWGMGGIGKTTIAGIIFHQYSREFEGKCFLANVREESEKGGGLVCLRERILSGILEETISNIGNPDLPEYIKRRIRRMKVLIVLDDVNNARQLTYLAGGIDRFGPGSRIIITTRDRRVLDNFGVCDTNIYKVRGLEYDDALELFCNHAFKEKHCPSDLLTLSERVLKYANGNPLVLKVLGSFFNQKSKLDLETSFEYLNQISDPDIYDVLKISYNDLKKEVQSIFLDIACFFVGENRDFVTRILDRTNSTENGLNVLIEKSLLTISDCDQIEMHDLLQELGREIVRRECVMEPGRRSRLWYHEDIYDVLRKNKGTDAIEGIFLNLSKIRDIHLASEAFAKMSKLRLLKFYMPELDGVPIMNSKIHLNQGLEYLPEELRYLHWHNYPLKSLPSNFDPENLVVLNLPYSKITKTWKGEKEAFKLRFINLHHCLHLTKIPKPLEIPNIIKLDLSENNLKSLPISIGRLRSLKELDLSGNNLESLPESVCCMSFLWRLDLSRNDLESLPENIGCLFALEWLNLNENYLESLPTSIGYLSSLCWLGLLGNYLESLPTSVCCLSSLQILNLSGNNLESLPESIGYLSSLKQLNLDDNCLESLPISIGCLSSLWYLDLSANNLESLPISIGRISSLKFLYLNENNLESLPASFGCLSSLHLLHLSENNFEESLASMEQLSQLRDHSLKDCNIKGLPLCLKEGLEPTSCESGQSSPDEDSETISKMYFFTCLDRDFEGLEFRSFLTLEPDFNFIKEMLEKEIKILEDSRQIISES